MTDREEGRRTRRSTGREDAGRGHIRPEGEGRLEGEKGRKEEETETRESGEPVGPRVRCSFCLHCEHCPTAPPRSPVCLANSRGSTHFRGHLKSQGTSAQMVWICHLEAETQANFPRTQGTPTAAREPLDPQGKGTLPVPTALSSMLLAPRDVSCREEGGSSCPSGRHLPTLRILEHLWGRVIPPFSHKSTAKEEAFLKLISQAETL